MDQTDGGATDFEVSPDRLARNARRLASLGDRFRNHAGEAKITPLPLGSSPPAQWFATYVADAAGKQGIRGLLHRVADELTGIGREVRKTSRSYRDADDTNAVMLNHRETD